MALRRFAVLAIAAWLALAPRATSGADAVKVRLDWLPRGAHAVFFVAEEKGYFRAADIALERVDPGTGSVDTLERVGRGEYDFGFADLPTLAVARARGVPVTALAVVNQRSPMALVALRGTGLRTPKDLEGKVVGVDRAGSTYVFYRALVAASSLDTSKVTEMPVPVPYEEWLLDRKVEVIVGYLDAEIPELEARAGGPGSLEIVPGADHGYDLLGSGLVAGEALLRTRPDLARRFTRAYLRALRLTLASPREAAAILARHRPELADKREVLLRQLEADVRSVTSPDTRSHGLGWNPPGRWQVTWNTLVRLGVIDATAGPPGGLYSNDFLK